VSKTVVDSGVKMNGNFHEFHRNALLSQKMLPAFKSVAGDTFIFQQDNAPVHGGNESSPFSCCNERPDVIAPDLWRPNNFDLNPVDWAVMQRRVYETRMD